jgi:hypothetical protein
VRGPAGTEAHADAMILYKYVPPERIDILSTGHVAFPPPWLFNDPFEASPVYAADASEAIALFEEYRPVRAQLTAEQERALQARIDAIQNAHGLRRIMLEQAARSVGVLSLSATNDNLLMWAHYTEQHTGFVIGFDTAQDGWAESGLLNGPPGEPSEIVYSDTRPAPVNITDTTPEHIWYMKSSEWKYEQEWRVTRWIPKAPKTATREDGSKVPLFPFPPEALSRIIFGCRASDVLQGEILEIITKPPYAGVTWAQAELDPDEFKLNIV